MSKIICGDSLKVLQSLPDNTVNCCVTSPPYFGLRDYDIDGQVGLETSPDEYVNTIVSIMTEVRRVLADDGTLWLNLGDSYNGSNKAGNPNSEYAKRHTAFGKPLDKQYHGVPVNIDWLKPKDLIGIPWMVAFALRASGWYLRSDIIWAKPNPMPSSVRDRCTSSHEYIFMLSKSRKYYFDAESIQEESVTKSSDKRGVRVHESRANDSKFWRKQDAVGKSNYTGFNKRYVHRAYRNKRDVWKVSVKPFKGAHFATFPADLIEPMILAGCPVGGTVLDPFFGSGTVGVVCDNLGRQFIGIDLNPDYCQMAYNRISKPSVELILES